jgi:hypothetical protein
MSGSQGQHEVQGQRSKPLFLSAADGSAPVCGLSLSPAERFQRAVQAGPLTADEQASFRSALARVRAQDEAKRSAPSPQLELAA